MERRPRGKAASIFDLMILSLRPVVLALLAISALCSISHAQGNYEIQVYGSETQAPRSTMVELHSNYTADGQKRFLEGVDPTNHAEHETIEITQGLTNWAEVGFYFFTSEQSGTGV